MMKNKLILVAGLSLGLLALLLPKKEQSTSIAPKKGQRVSVNELTQLIAATSPLLLPLIKAGINYLENKQK